MSPFPPEDNTAATPTTVAQRAVSELMRTRTLTEQSERRMGQGLLNFALYVQDARGVRDLNQVSGELATEFVVSPVGGNPASTSTMHFRRSVIRLLFTTARRLGLAEGEPTLELVLPARSPHRQRPLTDDEVAVCRTFAGHLAGTRAPTAWAIAEATGRTSEIPYLRASDVQLPAGRVRLQGGTKTDPRWGELTSWGIEQVRARLRTLNATKGHDPLVVYAGSGSAESRQASSCAAITEILRGAGLASEPDVRPGSVAAWAGACAFAQGLSIDAVALLLGVRSLDQAARLIGWAWEED